MKKQLSQLFSIGLSIFLISGCSSGSQDATYTPPTAEAVMDYLNLGWGDPACTNDGCFYFKAISAGPGDNPSIWCASVQSTTGTPYYDNDGNVARIDWDEPNISRECYRVFTNEDGTIWNTESAN